MSVGAPKFNEVVTPTWEYASMVAEEFRVKFGGVHSYIAAAIEYEHRDLKPTFTDSPHEPNVQDGTK